MSTVGTLITDIRAEIGDTDSTRFSADSQILPFVKRAIRRANRVCQINGIEFAKAFTTLATVASTAYVAMPGDFDVFIGLYRADTRAEIPMKVEWQWMELSGTASAELIGCKLDYANTRILLRGTPDVAISLDIWYYPAIDPSAYTTSSSMPWSGRLDDQILEYASMRLKNLDEYNIDVEKQLLADMETAILNAYQPNQQTVVDDKGWLG